LVNHLGVAESEWNRVKALLSDTPVIGGKSVAGSRCGRLT